MNKIISFNPKKTKYDMPNLNSTLNQSPIRSVLDEIFRGPSQRTPRSMGPGRCTACAGACPPAHKANGLGLVSPASCAVRPAAAANAFRPPQWPHSRIKKELCAASAEVVRGADLRLTAMEQNGCTAAGCIWKNADYSVLKLKAGDCVFCEEVRVALVK